MYRRAPQVEKDLYESIADHLSKEMKHIELSKIFSHRTVQLCNSALCNGLTGFMKDCVIVNSDITILDEGSVNLLNLIQITETTHIRRGTYQQRTVIVKQMPSVDRKNSLLNLGHELKILNYLGPNANVIPPAMSIKHI